MGITSHCNLQVYVRKSQFKEELWGSCIDLWPWHSWEHTSPVQQTAKIVQKKSCESADAKFTPTELLIVGQGRQISKECKREMCGTPTSTTEPAVTRGFTKESYHLLWTGSRRMPLNNLLQWGKSPTCAFQEESVKVDVVSSFKVILFLIKVL